MYVQDDESIGSEKGIHCIQYGIKQKQALLNAYYRDLYDCPSNRKNNKQTFLNMVYELPSLQWLLRTVFAYSEPAGEAFLALLNNKSPIWPGIAIHKNEVWANDTSEQTHMGKKYLLTIAIFGYRPSFENVELSSPVRHNASPDKTPGPP
ncbi:uncharacterized protein TNCV_3875601 [Trichonephila clavipes]|uniref:Uncharacterized protein n=1 Tax=Trichonephila clavipes TaxID=2585209 RepID=A0A8X6SRX5_TRICX|nr:uncharacterized protein TNCV_3875601 [Trichonephila clavipes]